MKHKKTFILISSLLSLFLSGCNKRVTINVFIYYKVSETCEKMGFIKGQSRQIPYCGDYTVEVTATPNAGYKFVEWSDGNKSASRKDKATEVAMTIYFATFDVV